MSEAFCQSADGVWKERERTAQDATPSFANPSLNFSRTV